MRGTKSTVSNRRNQIAIQVACCALLCRNWTIIISFDQGKWLKIQMHIVLILSFVGLLKCKHLNSSQEVHCGPNVVQWLKEAVRCPRPKL